MAAPGASGITPKPTPRPTPGPSRAPSIQDDDSETIAGEEADRFVVKSLDMQVKEGGKNFSAGECPSLRLSKGSLADQWVPAQDNGNCLLSPAGSSSSSRPRS